MTLDAHSYSVINPVPPLTPEQLAQVQAALAAQIADKVLEILLMNTNLTTMVTKSDVTEIVGLTSSIIIDDETKTAVVQDAVNKEDIIKEVKNSKV